MRLTLLYEKKGTKELGAAANTLALGLQKCKESVLALKPMFHSFLFHMKVTESRKPNGAGNHFPAPFGYEMVSASAFLA